MDGPMPASPSLKKNVPVEKLTSSGLGKATGDPLSEWADVKAALSLVPDKRSFQAERTLVLPWDGRWRWTGGRTLGLWLPKEHAAVLRSLKVQGGLHIMLAKRPPLGKKFLNILSKYLAAVG